MIDELTVTADQAEQIIKKAIEFEVYTDDVPETAKAKIEEAHEVVSFAIDFWNQEKPEEGSEAAQQIQEILDLAGVTITDDGEVDFGDVPDAPESEEEEPEAEAEPEEEEEGEADNDGEAPFDIDDLIEGYTELTAATKIKKIRALELDPSDDEDYNTLVAIAEFEENQDQPSSRVLDYLNELVPPEAQPDKEEEPEPDASAEDEDGEDTATPAEEEPEEEAGPWTEERLAALSKDDLKAIAQEFEVEWPQRLTDKGKERVIAAIIAAQSDGDGETSDDETGEPWEGYDEASDEDIVNVIQNVGEYVDGDPTEALEYIRTYESSMDEPSDVVLAAIDAALKGDEPEEEKPKTRRPKADHRGGTKSADPDVNDEVDQAVARDDDKERSSVLPNGMLRITREQILEALQNGSVQIKL
jgi:hypothetical protein